MWLSCLHLSADRLRRALLRELRDVLAARERIRAGDLARLEHGLEALEVVAHLLLRLGAEELRERGAGRTGRRRVAQLDPHLGAAPAGRRREAAGAGVVDVRALERAPRDQLVGPLLGDLGIPLDRLADRALRLPVRAALARD